MRLSSEADTPGGSATSAMMAMFEAWGIISINETIRSERLLGTGTFEGKLLGEVDLKSKLCPRS